MAERFGAALGERHDRRVLRFGPRAGIAVSELGRVIFASVLDLKRGIDRGLVVAAKALKPIDRAAL